MYSKADKAGDVETGDVHLLQAEGELVGFSMRSVRNGFVRKVFSILFVQLIVTFGVAALFSYNRVVGDWVRTTPFVLISAYVLTIALIIPLACFERVRRTYPHNMAFLAAFTICEAYLVGAVTASYQIHTVMMAFIITIGVVASLTLFATQTKYDFTLAGGVLVSLLMSLIVFGFLTMFFPGPFAHKVYALIGAMLFSAFLVYDIQVMMGDRKRSISLDEYVFAALNLYLDILNLFLFILALLGGGRN